MFKMELMEGWSGSENEKEMWGRGGDTLGLSNMTYMRKEPSELSPGWRGLVSKLFCVLAR